MTDTTTAARPELDLDAIRARARAATPGPWRRPLNTRHRCHVEADLPDGEEPRLWRDGINPDTGAREPVEIVSVPTWSNGKFMRARSGRDLEFIAHAPADIAALLAEVDRLRERIDAALALVREAETRDQDGWPVVDTASLHTALISGGEADEVVLP